MTGVGDEREHSVCVLHPWSDDRVARRQQARAGESKPFAQQMVQVRNRVITAYHDIMNRPV